MAERKETLGLPEPLQGFSKSPGSGLIKASATPGKIPRIPGLAKPPKATKVPKLPKPKGTTGKIKN